MFTVEAVNKLVEKGIPFREAYQLIGHQVEAGTFQFSGTIEHSHEGSLGNLCTEKIKTKFEYIFQQFNFEKINVCLNNLLKNKKLV